MCALNKLRAVKKRDILFVQDLLHSSEGSPVARSIRQWNPAEYRVWLKCMAGIYPTQTYLQRIGLAKSSTCLLCVDGLPETLTHFAATVTAVHILVVTVVVAAIVTAAAADLLLPILVLV